MLGIAALEDAALEVLDQSEPLQFVEALQVRPQAFLRKATQPVQQTSTCTNPLADGAGSRLLFCVMWTHPMHTSMGCTVHRCVRQQAGAQVRGL